MWLFTSLYETQGRKLGRVSASPRSCQTAVMLLRPLLPSGDKTAHWPRVCPHRPRFPLFLSTLKQVWTSSHHQPTCSLLLSSKHRTVRFRIGKCCLAWRRATFALQGHVSAGVCPGLFYTTQSCLSHLENFLFYCSFPHQRWTLYHVCHFGGHFWKYKGVLTPEFQHHWSLSAIYLREFLLPWLKERQVSGGCCDTLTGGTKPLLDMEGESMCSKPFFPDHSVYCQAGSCNFCITVA